MSLFHVFRVPGEYIISLNPRFFQPLTSGGRVGDSFFVPALIECRNMLHYIPHSYHSPSGWDKERMFMKCSTYLRCIKYANRDGPFPLLATNSSSPAGYRPYLRWVDLPPLVLPSPLRTCASKSVRHLAAPVALGRR